MSIEERTMVQNDRQNYYFTFPMEHKRHLIHNKYITPNLSLHITMLPPLRVGTHCDVFILRAKLASFSLISMMLHSQIHDITMKGR